MAMPEAAVNEDDLSTLYKYDIGYAGKFRLMKAEAVPQSV